MKFLPPDLDISEDEGFDPRKDIFGRKLFADQLTSIIQSIEGGGVLLLDAPWGTGKTVFLKMWRGELSKSGLKTIYFDAFANDYHDDAFLTIAGEIIARSTETASKSDELTRDFTQKAVRVGKILARSALRLGVHVATAGIVSGGIVESGIKATSDIAAMLKDESSKAIDEIIQDSLESHRKDREIFDEFRSALRTLAKTLAQSETSANNNPLIIIIDELDRCRPDFALDLIKKIKHFFSVSSVIFIISANLKQLESVVRFSYGDIDAYAYLEKFYHMRVLLPSGRHDKPNTTTKIYLDHLFYSELRSNNANEIIEIINIINEYSKQSELHLRTLERIAIYCNIIISNKQRIYLIPQIATVLYIMKVSNPTMYQKARSDKLTFSDIENFTKFRDWRRDYRPDELSHEGVKLSLWWRYALGETLSEEESNRISTIVFRINISSPRGFITRYCDLIDLSP